MILIVEYSNSCNGDEVNEGTVIATFSDPEKAESFLEDYKEEFGEFDGAGDGAMMVTLPDSLDFSKYPRDPKVKDLIHANQSTDRFIVGAPRAWHHQSG